MHDSRNLTIGVLTITATVLFVGLVLTTSGPDSQAVAYGQLDRGGDYVIFTGQFTQNTELVYIVDAAAKRLVAYSYETSNRQIRLWDAVDLAQFGARKKK